MADSNSKSPLLQYNPNDPLNQRIQSSKGLYLRVAQLASGFPMDHVVDTAFNLLVQGLRQTYANRSDVERRVNDICGQLKQVVLDHYDTTTGKRKNIFPFDQRVEMPLHIDEDKFQ